MQARIILLELCAFYKHNTHTHTVTQNIHKQVT